MKNTGNIFRKGKYLRENIFTHNALTICVLLLTLYLKVVLLEMLIGARMEANIQCGRIRGGENI